MLVASSNYQGNIVCSINSSDGAFDTKDDGLNGRYDPTTATTSRTSSSASPAAGSRSATGSNGTDSFTRNPWGG